MIKIILCIIIKNESKIIKRLINNVIDFVDAISITDTGSTDNTISCIESIKSKNTFIYSNIWINFGINRTESFKNCIETANKLKYPLNKTYALLLDADMEIKVLDFNKQELKSKAFNILQKNGDLSYYNTRLIRLDEPTQCLGVTHEYWNIQSKTEILNENSIYILDHNDGGCKHDKITRDIQLLSDGLLTEPENSRYMFYLANSYRDVGENEKAIQMYSKHLNYCKWNEELWYSIMQIGILSNNLKDTFYWLLHAYEFRPLRAESLYFLAKYCRINNLYNQAILFLNMAKQILYPKDDVLFIDNSVYTYKILYEISICAYYTLFKTCGLEASKQLLSLNCVPKHIKNSVKENLRYYE